MGGEILGAIVPSLFRRWLAFAAIVVSGGVLIYAGIGDTTTGLIWKLLLIGGGAALIVLADRLRRATSVAIEFTADGLRESTGRVLCTFDDIEKVERGAFAFKPSNGLLVRLKTPADAAWAPGLWWRYGRKIGIGGVTSAGQSKAMSDMIALHSIMQAQDDQ